MEYRRIGMNVRNMAAAAFEAPATVRSRGFAESDREGSHFLSQLPVAVEGKFGPGTPPAPPGPGAHVAPPGGRQPRRGWHGPIPSFPPRLRAPRPDPHCAG